MKPKALWVLIAFLIWGAGSTYWYVCQIKGFCNPSEVVLDTSDTNTQAEKVVQKTSIPKMVRDLLSFDWSSNRPVLKDNNEWTGVVKSLAQLRAEGKKLRIEAPYYAEEENTTSFENLGLARAEQIKKLLAKQIDPKQIITGSRLLSLKDSIHPEFTNAYKGYIGWVVDNDFVKEHLDKTLIYFPFNSNKEIKNKRIINYLDNLVENLQKNKDSKVSIVGYTDNVGDHETNKQLGLKRAERIKNVLINRGIASDRILIDSKGEMNPIATNETPEGRQQNRRVEIIIIK